MRPIFERLHEIRKEGLQCFIHPWRHYTDLILKLSWSTLQGTTSPKQAIDYPCMPSVIVPNTTSDYSNQLAIITMGIMTVATMTTFLFQLMVYYDRKDAFFTCYNG